jgi:hypothetical protein
MGGRHGAQGPPLGPSSGSQERARARSLQHLTYTPWGYSVVAEINDRLETAMTRLNRRFARHYLEMVAAMFLGMAVLWMPAREALAAAGMSSSELRNDAPALLLSLMAVTMTVPMVAWMRYRGHGWRPSAEMSASMLVPAAGTIALLGAGLVEDLGALLLVEHVAMLLGMLVAMLLRPAEYSGGDHAHGHRQHELAA